MKTLLTISLMAASGLLGYMLNQDSDTRTTSAEKNSTVQIDPTGCEFDSSCCPDVEYCGITKDSLLKYIANYRDKVWSQTSPYFKTHNYDPQILINGKAPKNVPEAFDARYMDIELNYLKNYICRIKNSSHEELQKTNYIRMYYIRYKDLKKSEHFSVADSVFNINYDEKHSLAIVPVFRNDGISEELIELKDSAYVEVPLVVGPGPHCATGTKYANYNQLCPPLIDCGDIKSTLMYQADSLYK